MIAIVSLDLAATESSDMKKLQDQIDVLRELESNLENRPFLGPDTVIGKCCAVILEIQSIHYMFLLAIHTELTGEKMTTVRTALSDLYHGFFTDTQLFSSISIDFYKPSREKNRKLLVYTHNCFYRFTTTNLQY